MNKERQEQFNLARFKSAQEPVFETVLAELRQGYKKTHWMWFIFPQMAGIGNSSTANFFGLISLEEAKAYLADEILNERLRLCTQAVINSSKSLNNIFGSPDDLKFCSSMTVFALAVTPEQPNCIFQTALNLKCAGNLDAKTIRLVR